jgi:C-terminal processing protease CtpA/Prc
MHNNRLIYAKCLIFSSICLFFLTSTYCFSDIIYTLDDIEIEGVIIENDQDKIVLESNGQKIHVLTSNIKTIHYDPELKNLLLLADSEKKKKDFSKAYYLYKRAFLIDPESPEAISGLSELDSYIFNQTDAKNDGASLVSDHERFQGNDNTMGDSQILKTNSDISQELINKMGLVLEVVSDKIIIAQVVNNSPAYLAGVKNSDKIFEINDKPVEYMGLFDVSENLINNRLKEAKLLLDRNINVWVDTKERITIPPLIDLAGFSLQMDRSGLIISNTRHGSEMRHSGAIPGDRLIAINYEDVTRSSLDEIKEKLAGYSPGIVIITIRKQIELSH